jgi:hypothetical protein
MQRTDEHLQIREAQDSASSGEHNKGVGWGKIRPSGGKRADLASGRVLKEYPRLPPGKPLHEEGKLLAGQAMESVGDGEANLLIGVMGCS